MRLHGRQRFKLGPLRFNFSLRNGLTSWGWKVGRLSWNSRTNKHRVDLPGPFWATSSGRRKR